MSNIKRFDPSASTSSLAQNDGLTDLARKIQERQLKRKTAESLPPPISTPSAAAPASAKVEIAEWQPAAGESPAEREKREKKEKLARILSEVIPEWKPAEGESPAEREKREKREKRAGKLGVSFDMGFAGPTGSSYVPPPSEYALPDQSAQFEGAYSAYDNSSFSTGTGSTGAASIHPSRMAAAPILGKEKKEKDPNKEKTTAKKLYLKRKRERSKGKKAGEPAAPSKRAKKFKKAEGDAEEVGGEVEEDSDESSVDSDDERDKLEAVEKKKNDILKKKEERKIKRDEKKVEARRVKAEGGVPVAIVPRIVPTKVVAAPPVVEMDIDAAPAEPTAEELELAVIEAARASRKLAKREKRTARRLPSPSPPPSTLIPTAHEEVVRSPTPEIEMESIPQPGPAPLLRLPGATRPAPPSAKTLSALKVHESVRDKLVIDPELKIAFGENGVVLSERAIKRLGEMGITDAFAGQSIVIQFIRFD